MKKSSYSNEIGRSIVGTLFILGIIGTLSIALLSAYDRLIKGNNDRLSDFYGVVFMDCLGLGHECGDTCCENHLRCQHREGEYSCVPFECKSDADCPEDVPRCYTEVGRCGFARCTSDADCPEKAPFCNMVLGRCFTDGCRDNDDCNSGQYCHLIRCVEYTNDERCTEEKPGRGRCLDTVKTTVGEYTISKDSMNWWSAENFCKSLNKQLIDYESLNSNGSAIGGTLSDDLTALQAAFGKEGEVWTGTLWGGAFAWTLDLSGKAVGKNDLYWARYALCR